MIQHIGKETGEWHVQEIFLHDTDGGCCPPYQSHSEGLPFGFSGKFYWAQTQSQGSGHKILGPRKEMAATPSQNPASEAEFWLQALSLAQKITSSQQVPLPFPGFQPAGKQHISNP